MNPNARISALEAKLNALTLIIEKQNDTITALTLRLDLLQAPKIEIERAPEYVPQFTQWPKGVGG
jgi:hypothetical protein